MSTLFDVSEKPSRKKQARPAAPKEKAVFIPPRPMPPPIGRLDDGAACIDTACGAECHDILLESKGRWLLECCFCGTGQWVQAIAGHLPPEPEGGDFVLRGGRFDGLSIAQVAEDRRGEDYIRWAAAEHPREAVKKACKTWLASNGESL